MINCMRGGYDGAPPTHISPNTHAFMYSFQTNEIIHHHPVDPVAQPLILVKLLVNIIFNQFIIK